MVCERCGKEFREDWRKDKGLRKSQPTPRFCSRACSSARVFTEEANRKRSISNAISSKRVAAERRERLLIWSSCEICGKKTQTLPFKKRRTCSAECRNALNSRMALDRQKSRHHSRKDTMYKGVLLNSSYEEAVAKELDEANILWERPKPIRWIDAEGKKHWYYPDFYLPEFDVFLDPKNDYLINNVNKWFGITDKEKIERVEQQNGVRVLILSKENLLWEKIQAILS